MAGIRHRQLRQLIVADLGQPVGQRHLHQGFQIRAHHGDHRGIPRCVFIHNRRALPMVAEDGGGLAGVVLDIPAIQLCQILWRKHMGKKVNSRKNITAFFFLIVVLFKRKWGFKAAQIF